MIGTGDIPLTNYWLINFFYLRLWFSVKKKKIYIIAKTAICELELLPCTSLVRSCVTLHHQL